MTYTPITIYVVYDPSDGDVLCAYMNEEDARNECEQHGLEYCITDLYKRE